MVEFILQFIFRTIICSIVAFIVVWICKDKIKIYSVPKLLSITVSTVATALVTTKLLAIVEGLMIDVWAANRMYGVFIILPPILFALARLFRLDKRNYLDLVAVAIITALFLNRVLCLINGCCDGKHIFSTEYFWPVREMELLFFIVIFVILFKKIKTSNGELFPILMISYGFFRFIIEWLRVANEFALGLHIAHLWSVLCILGGLSIYLEMKANMEMCGNKLKGRS